jgi:hypothetical protein|tara:strand:- start:65 stop:352 length:288 start_codon:yes stop_codon:yes gene_type:complete
MTAKKAKRHINESEDFLVFTRKREIINIDHKNNDSLNILLDLAVANPNFLELLKSVIKSIDEYTNQKSTDQSGEDRPEQPPQSEQGEVQEAEVIG